jgi:hypothetical protein
MFGTYQRLGLHVMASNVDVILTARAVIGDRQRRGPAFRARRKRFYHAMLRYHADARALFVRYRF